MVAERQTMESVSITREKGVDTLIDIFNRLFLKSYNTELIAGDKEPIYLPADAEHGYNRLIFAHGFFSSALHEIAHWCIAGEARRQRVDFGYWYKPDGRTTEEQALFEQVEVLPQAYEWILSVSANHKFHFSADNLSGECGASEEFMRRVHQQVLNLVQQSLPNRLGLLCDALREWRGVGALHADMFALQPHLPFGVAV